MVQEAPEVKYLRKIKKSIDRLADKVEDLTKVINSSRNDKISTGNTGNNGEKKSTSELPELPEIPESSLYTHNGESL